LKTQPAHRTSTCPVIWLLMAVAAVSAGCRSFGVAPPPPTACLSPRSTVWLMSARGVPCGGQPGCFRFAPQGNWIPTSMADFHAYDDPQVPTVFYAHGGRATAEDAIDMGWDVLRQLSPPDDPRPFRLVIYSWPGGRYNLRMVSELREWSTTAEQSGATLAAAIGQVPPDVPVSLVGHSYGASVILSALDGLARSEAGQNTLAPPGNGRRYRVVMMAPAIENTCVWPGQRYGASLYKVERLLLLYNTRDMLLSQYHWVRPGRNERALGYTGFISVPRLPDPQPQVAQLDVNQALGTRHRWTHYEAANVLRNTARDFVLFEGETQLRIQPEGAVIR
jgi:pimeloyl-ACP methyl ester carboxylesterase